MRKMKIFALIGLMLTSVVAKADEGMWLPFMLGRNYADMKKHGLKMTAEQLYSINKSSMKDAIISFGGFCTGEVISDKGLVLTNHHCGYDAIAGLSTPEHDYLTNGFWSKNHEEELKPEKLSVRFFVRMDNVSERILSLVNNDMTELEREAIVNKEIAKIEKENNENGKYTVSVRSFFEGNEYYYFVYEDYNDVRLVGTPPNAIGKFGGDTDNWEWPRHTGDFSVFRVYTDQDGNAAEYSESNIPMKPKYHLPVSLKGYKEGDFSMILGYPGRTNRWMPAMGVQQNVKYSYPAWVEGSGEALKVMRKYMKEDQKVRLDYAGQYAGIANYYKNRQGMIDALKEHKTVQSKKKMEKQFDKWAKNNEEYKGVVKTINNYYKNTNKQALQHNYLFGMLRSASFAVIPYRFSNMLTQYVGVSDDKKAAMREEIETNLEGTLESLHLPLEQEVYAAQLALYYKKAKKGGLAPYIKEVGDKNKGDFTKYISDAFENSVFTNAKKLNAYLSNPDASIIQNDELFKMSTAILTRYRSQSEKDIALKDDFDKAFRKLVAGLKLSGLSPIEYPDANSTLRLTYGTIRALPLGDKVNDAQANYYTTLKGTIAKHIEGDDEFEVPAKLIELYNAKDYGQYADANGELWVNFLTDHDITGGNSGSPVINGKGELIGIAFDGNIEAMAGDVIFDPVLQRAISVDIRYVLFVIDKFAGATNIIDEMTIIK